MNQHNGSVWEPNSEHAPERDIYSASLVEDPAHTGIRRRNIADAVAGAVVSLVAWIRMKMVPSSSRHGAEGFLATTHDATHLAVRAVEGRLEGQSLDGQLKSAQIAREYAEAARANAEADEIRLRTAWSRIEKTLAVYNALGVPVQLVRLPDGKLCLSVGDGFTPAVAGEAALRDTVLPTDQASSEPEAHEQ